MKLTQSALVLLMLCWTLQLAGSWWQWKSYRRTLSDATSRWSDGFLGMGHHKSRWRHGAIALLEVGPQMKVRRLQTMSGFSVFARFKPMAHVQGWTVSQLATHFAPGKCDSAIAHAIRQAIVKVEEARAEQQ
jgi:glucitol operon activator protein